MAGPVSRQRAIRRTLSTSTSDSGRRFSSASDATKELHEAYHGWSGSLASLAWKSALGLIAANWAVHGQQVLANPWARASVALALLYLLVLMAVSGLLAWLHNKRLRYADADKERWKAEFEQEADSTQWPYDWRITAAGKILQVSSVFLILISGVALLISLPLLPGAPRPPSPTPESVLRPDAGQPIELTGGRNWDPGVMAMWAGLAMIAAATWSSLMQWKGRDRAAAVVGAAGLTLFSAGAFAKFQVNASFDPKIALQTEALLKIVRQEVKATAAPGPEQIGAIDRFVSGEAALVLSPDGSTQAAGQAGDVKKALNAWISRQATQHDGVLLVIGATDRQPLNRMLLGRYETNVGLAQARGEVIKAALIEQCRIERGCTLDGSRVIVLVAGPRRTQPQSGTRPTDGYPEDRRVEIWALWSRKDDTVIRP